MYHSIPNQSLMVPNTAEISKMNHENGKAGQKCQHIYLAMTTRKQMSLTIRTSTVQLFPLPHPRKHQNKCGCKATARLQKAPGYY